MRVGGLASFLVSTLVVVACGSDDDGGGQESSDVAACKDMCAAQYQACPESLAECGEICQFVAGSFTGDCQAKAQAFYQCGAAIEWTCSGLMAQKKDLGQCKTEEEAYGPCLSQK